MMRDETPLLHNETIDRFNQEKLYIQLTRIFLEQINSGKWQLGHQIPTEEELCKKHNVSKITVRQAISNLVSDGYLIKIQGRGTFVTSSLPAVGIAMKTKLTEDMLGKGVSVRKEILIKDVREAPSDVKAYLGIEYDIYYILCKRIVDGDAAYLDESFIPQYLMPGLEIEDICQNSFYDIIQEKAVKKVYKMLQTIELTEIGSEFADILNIKECSPCILLHRLFIGADGSPIAYTRLIGSGQKYKIQTEFERIR